MDSVCAEKKEKMISFPLSTCTLSTVQAAEAAAKLIKTDGWEHNSDVVLQTASATLTALMTQFSKNMEKKSVVNTKTLPVISIHA
jgi:oligoribonuclease NrnB/cAMP/cGMP phosphodiesterase (DHH superfamily)